MDFEPGSQMHCMMQIGEQKEGYEYNSESEYDEQKEGNVQQNIPQFSWGNNWPPNISPKYKHLKEEMLNNKFAPITEKTWNEILKKCTKILKGQFSSKRKNRWAKLLRDNKIRMKHLVCLKLYTDYDLLQREFG